MGVSRREFLQTGAMVMAVAHVDATLECPSGPLVGKSQALFSMVMRRAGSGWEIVSFHNTLLPRS